MVDFEKDSVDVIINYWEENKHRVKNQEFYDIINRIVERYYNTGEIADHEIHRIREVVYYHYPFAFSAHGEIDSPKAILSVTFSEVPQNCEKCPMCKEGRCIWGCTKKNSKKVRPDDCPIKLI